MDFTGITYKNQHSSKFGLTRVSDGSRYQEILVPNSSIYTSEVPGGDGVYYFGRNLRGRVFPLSFAFDSVTETQLRQIKNWLAPDGLGDLIFDELPYKRWICIVTNAPEFNYICFDEWNGHQYERKYKGEVDIEFTSYYPYAFNNYGKCLNDYVNIFEPNIKYTGIENDEYQFNPNGPIKIENDYNNKLYSLAELDGAPEQFIETVSYDNITDALQKGHNIWDDMETINLKNNDGSYRIDQDTKIIGGEELLRHLSFIGKNSLGESNKNSQNYYLSCDFTLEKTHVSDRITTAGPVKEGEVTGGIAYKYIDGMGAHPKMGLYIRKIKNGVTKYYPLISWEFVNRRPPADYSDNWSPGHFIYDLKSYKTRTIQVDFSSVALQPPDQFGPDLIQKNIFTDPEELGEFITADGQITYDLVGFGIPIGEIITGNFAGLTYYSLRVSNIKIVEKLTNNRNSMNTNMISPYPGGYNYTYHDGVMSSLYLINRKADLTYDSILQERLAAKAYTKNIMRIIDDFKKDKVPGFSYPSTNQTFIIKENFKTVKIPFVIPTCFNQMSSNYFKIFIKLNSGVSDSTEFTININNSNNVSIAGTTIVWNKKDSISASIDLSNSSNISNGYVVITRNDEDQLTGEYKINMGIFENSTTPYIGYSELELYPFKQTSLKYSFNGGKTNFINKTFQSVKEIQIRTTEDINKWNWTLYNGTYMIGTLEVPDLDANYPIISTHFRVISPSQMKSTQNIYIPSNDADLKHGICYIHDTKIYIVLCHNNLDENFARSYLRELRRNMGLNSDNWEPGLSFRYTSSLNNNIYIDEIPKASYINNSYYYYWSNLPAKFKLASYNTKDFNIDEWQESSGLPNYNEDCVIADNLLNLPNYGDLETDWKIQIRKKAREDFSMRFLEQDSQKGFTISFSQSDAISDDLHKFYITNGIIEIDTAQSSITYKPNGLSEMPIYNILTEGDFFKLKPFSQNIVKISGAFGTENASNRIETIDYNYLYY